MALCEDALALVAFVDAMAVGRGRESRHDAATDSFMVMSDLLYGGDYMKTDSPLDAAMKRVETL